MVRAAPVCLRAACAGANGARFLHTRVSGAELVYAKFYGLGAFPASHLHLCAQRYEWAAGGSCVRFRSPGCMRAWNAKPVESWVHCGARMRLYGGPGGFRSLVGGTVAHYRGKRPTSLNVHAADTAATGSANTDVSGGQVRSGGLLGQNLRPSESHGSLGLVPPA